MVTASSATALPSVDSDSGATGGRINALLSADTFSPPFADVLQIVSAARRDAAPAPKLPAKPAVSDGPDDAPETENANDVSARHDASETADTNGADRTHDENNSDDKNDDKHGENATPESPSLARPALLVDLPPPMTPAVAVVTNAAPTVAVAPVVVVTNVTAPTIALSAAPLPAPSAPASALPTSVTTPNVTTTPNTAAVVKPAASANLTAAVNAPTTPAVPVSANAPVAGSNTPATNLANANAALTADPILKIQNPKSPDSPAGSMDSNAVTPVVPASGVESAPPAVGAPAQTVTRSAAPVTIPAALVPQESPPVQTTNAPKSPSVAVAAPTIAGTAATPRTQTILAAQPGPVPVAAKPTTQAAPPALPDTSVIAAAPASASMETVPAPSGKTAAKIETTLPSANVAQATPVKQPSAPAVAETNAAAQIQNSKFKIENPTSPLPSPFAIGTDGSPVIVTPTLAANADPTVSLVANPLTPAVASVVESSVAVIRQSAAPELRNGIGSSLPVNETAKTAGTVASAGQQTAANSGGNESRNNNNANSNGGQRETARIAAVSGTANAGKTETASPVFSLGTGAGTNVSEIGDVSEIRNAKSGSQNLDRIQLVAQVTKHLEALRVRDGKSEMAINLRPDHLGSLRVTIATHADGVTARIVAEHHSVQQALESAKQDLRAALESKGLRLTQLDVTTNDSAGDGRTAFGNGSENGSRQPGLVPRPLRTSRNAESPEAAPIALVASRTGSTTLLDRVA